MLNVPTGVDITKNGDIIIADTGNSRVRMIVMSTGKITTIAGTGTDGYNGDGIAATSAQINYPRGVASDISGNVYIADQNNNRIRFVDFVTKKISTIAGVNSVTTVDDFIGGQSTNGGYNGDGILATLAQLNSPSDVVINNIGDIIIADSKNHRIRKITKSNGIIRTIGGNGVGGFSPDGFEGTATKLNYPMGVAISPTGDLLVADTENRRIRGKNLVNY